MRVLAFLFLFSVVLGLPPAFAAKPIVPGVPLLGADCGNQVFLAAGSTEAGGAIYNAFSPACTITFVTQAYIDRATCVANSSTVAVGGATPFLGHGDWTFRNVDLSSPSVNMDSITYVCTLLK